MARRVVVTGLGICSPLGTGAATVWRRLLEGACGITSVPKTADFENVRSRVGGFVPRGDGPAEFNESAWVSAQERKYTSLPSAFAICASAEALKDANWKPESQEDRFQTGVCIGGHASPRDVVRAGELVSSGQYRKVTPYLIPLVLPNMSSGLVSMRFGLQGPNHSVSTACATGTHALGDAAAMIKRGACDVMVAGGTEACVESVVMFGFQKAKALSTRYNDTPQKASRPFDAGRDGFVMSEGAAVMVLEELEHAKARNAKIYAEILGYGMAGDAYHITKPSGVGAVRAMQMSLNDAGLPPEAVGHVNAHATSTPLGDANENRAVKKVFGEHADKLQISAPKGATGHMLAACGTAEAIFAALAVRGGIVPPTLNLKNLEPEFDLNYVPNTAQKWSYTGGRRVAVSNSFGFGGTNATICIGQY